MTNRARPDLDRDRLAAVLRTDLPSFTRKVFATLNLGSTFEQAWSFNALAYQLERIRRGENRRLIVNMPPRSLKSISASVAFPAFLLGHDPTKRIICVSYAAELARKHSHDFRAVINAPWYRELFPGTRINTHKNNESEIEFTDRGFRLATSVGGTLTGRGGDIIIVDDPLKPLDALSEATRCACNLWFSNTLLSRLDDKLTGAIIIVMQRVHTDDLAGFVVQQSDDWEVLALPAIAETDAVFKLPNGRRHHRKVGDVLFPGREPLTTLEELRRQIGADLFQAQYQQMPVPPGGAMVKRDWVQRYEELPPAQSRLIVQSWDTAVKGGPDNDWSVCTTWVHTLENDLWYLVDVWRERVNYPELKLKVVELARHWSADTILVEEAGTAVALIEELRLHVTGLRGVRPERDKEVRMAVASAKIQSSHMLFPKTASWLAVLEAELFAFPGSRHDDQVDSISQALNSHNGLGIWASLAAQIS